MKPFNYWFFVLLFSLSFSLSFFFFPSLSFKSEFTPTARTGNILMFLLVFGGRLRLFMRIATLQKCLLLEVNWGRFSCTGSHRFNTWNIFVSNRPSPTNSSPPDQEFGSDAVWPFQTFLSRVDLSNATACFLSSFFHNSVEETGEKGQKPCNIDPQISRKVLWRPVRPSD